MKKIHITVSASLNSKSGKLVFNSLAMDDIGLCTSTNRMTNLENPYSENDVGNALKVAIQLTKEKPFLDNSIRGSLHEQLGMTQSKFVKEYLQVMVDVMEERSVYVFSPMRRYGTKGYTRNHGDKEMKLLLKADVEDLGKTLLEAFRYCK